MSTELRNLERLTKTARISAKAPAEMSFVALGFFPADKRNEPDRGEGLSPRLSARAYRRRQMSPLSTTGAMCIIGITNAADIRPTLTAC